MLPTVLLLSSDSVPNVRFNVAKTLKLLAKDLDQRFVGLELLDQNSYLAILFLQSSVVQNQIKPCLTKLLKDSDNDVRYYADEGLRSL